MIEIQKKRKVLKTIKTISSLKKFFVEEYLD